MAARCFVNDYKSATVNFLSTDIFFAIWVIVILAKPMVGRKNYHSMITSYTHSFLQDHNYRPPSLNKTAILPWREIDTDTKLPLPLPLLPRTTPLLADDQSTNSAALGGEYDIRYLSGNNCRGEVAQF